MEKGVEFKLSKRSVFRPLAPSLGTDQGKRPRARIAYEVALAGALPKRPL